MHFTFECEMLLVSYNDWTQCKVWHVHQVVHFTAGCVPAAAPLIWQVGGPGLDHPPAVAVLLPTIARRRSRGG